jgi:hypothetical protein
MADVREIAAETRKRVRMRGLYGGIPTEVLDAGEKLADLGINAIFVGSGALNEVRVARLRAEDVQVYAEFNTLHEAGYLKEHPDAAPIGTDGQVCPPPDDWQGVCPTHPGYREYRMAAFRQALRRFEIDGIWLDYHHSHASWEQAEPTMPDTCFCPRCLAQFQRETGVRLPAAPAEAAKAALGEHHDRWTRWRCGVFTDWVREFKQILRETRPKALLGTYHCPWTDSERNSALTRKLAIDLKAQAEFIDIFSPMPYHARFGHHRDPSWISRQSAWLGRFLGIEGKPGERHRIWPIVQLSDWGEHVPPQQVAEVLDHGTRAPATGVQVFNWGGLQKQMENFREMAAVYRKLAG